MSQGFNNNIQQPAPLLECGNKAVNWKEFKRSFDFFIIASGREKISSKEKCALLLHVIGKYGREIYDEFDFDNENYDYDTLIGKFDKRFDPKKNVNFERHLFFETNQKQRTFDDFLSDLKTKSKSCEFGLLRNSLILTQMIRGHKDSNIRERLLARSSLNLDEAETICREAERASLQAVACVGADDSHKKDDLEQFGLVEENIAYARYGWRGRGQFRRSYGRTTNGSQRRNMCTQCNGWHGMNERCPAYNVRCYKCERFGHFAKCCKIKTVRAIEAGAGGDAPIQVQNMNVKRNDNELFLSGLYINAVDSLKESWYEKIYVNNVLITFKLDSGADASVMSIKTFLEAGFNINNLIKCNVILKEISKNQLPVLGYFTPNLKYKMFSTIQKIFVLDVDCNNLLGLKACTELQLILRINEITDYNFDTSIFDGIGCLPTTVKIFVDKTVSPVVSTSRKVPMRLRPRLKEELDNMEKLGIIAREDGPTDWVSNIVVVEKPDKTLRVCLDPFHLNKAVRRSHFQLPTLEEIASELNGAKYFSKLDASKGFWILRLEDESSKLCTFSSPFGRYRFLRMPFGINCAPEIFHNEMFKIFKTEGVTVYIDDILVVGKTKNEHDIRLNAVIRKAKENNIRFNKGKCIFGVNQVTYLGHVFDEQGMRPDNSRISAIVNMPEPADKKELERFLGITNYLARFIPNYSQISAPLRELLKKDVEFLWNNKHKVSYLELKAKISGAPVLRYYSPHEEVTLSVDASSYGLGACLMQDKRPVAYASRTLTPAETRWAQIEKELLAIVFGCIRFHQYVYGHTNIIVETDHKPLESIFKKPLNSTPARLQRMLMKLQGYDLNIRYKPGKELHIADTLSRAPCDVGCDKEIYEKVTVHVNALYENVNVSKEKLNLIKIETEKDEILKQVQYYYINGWPEHKNKVNNLARQFWTIRNDLHVIDGIVFRNDQIIIPTVLRKDTLSKIHEGHMGIEKCKRRAKDVVWWPGMSTQIEEMVQNCEICLKYRTAQRREPLHPHPVPNLPWEVLAADIFQIDVKYYLLVVDYYSKFLEIVPLNNLTTNAVITNMRVIFARFGIPQKLVTDNGPQFSSTEFKEFVIKWEFQHITSSPLYPRSNGLAERNVQTAKKLIIKAKEDGEDWLLALLNFRNTPISEEEYSPAQLLMGRRLNTRLPAVEKQLLPKNIEPSLVKEKRNALIDVTKKYYDRGTRELPSLHPGEKVYVRDNNKKTWDKGEVVREAGDRSYWVITENGGKYRRNRSFIIGNAKNNRNTSQMNFDDIPSNEETPVPSTSNGIITNNNNIGDGVYTTRSGRVVRPPVRFY